MTWRSAALHVLATLIDIACMLPWIVVVAAAGAVLWVSGITHSIGPVAGNVVGFVTLIAPITIVAAGFEGATRHATPGKRLLRLEVTHRFDGAPTGFARALVRNAIKYALPWQLGHTAVFALWGTTTVPPVWVTVALVGAYAVPLVSVVLLVWTGRALHDRVAQTRVATARARAQAL